ncbi:MAG: phosphatase PAP2 family protein [Flavobacteriaceae bacterium]
MLEKILQVDREVFIRLNNLGSEPYDVFWSTVSKFTTWIPLFVLLILFIFLKNTRQHAVWMLLSFMSMLMLLTPFIWLTQYWVGRLRPNNDPSINTLVRIVQTPDDYSFFSSQAAMATSIALLAILFLRKKWAWIHWVWIFPVLYSLSAIFLGVNYPLDIFFGGLVGALFALFFYRLHQRLKAPYL